MSLSSPHPTLSSQPNLPQSAAELLTRLKAETEKKQLQLIYDIAAAGEAGLDLLMGFLLERRPSPVTPIDGCAYQQLAKAESAAVQTWLQTHLPNGIVPLESERGIDYSAIQTLLLRQEYQAADQLTIEKLCELAGVSATQRKWLYFSEVEQFPVTDLQTINRLWLVFSEGKFGYSVQRELWLSNSKSWERLWEKIGWKKGNTWTRYPHEFTWTLEAPRGHLPLSNQLRGVRVISSLLTHPAWMTSVQ